MTQPGDPTAGGDAIAVVHVPAKRRYEIRDGEQVIGFTQYRVPDEGHIDFVHTEIHPEHSGRGLASRLVSHAVDDASSQGRRIVPHCSFVASWIRRHPEYAAVTDWPEPQVAP